jgi:hypothetical protein
MTRSFSSVAGVSPTGAQRRAFAGRLGRGSRGNLLDEAASENKKRNLFKYLSRTFLAKKGVDEISSAPCAEP